jgi:hypothetical protein
MKRNINKWKCTNIKKVFSGNDPVLKRKDKLSRKQLQTTGQVKIRTKEKSAFEKQTIHLDNGQKK